MGQVYEERRSGCGGGVGGLGGRDGSGTTDDKEAGGPEVDEDEDEDDEAPACVEPFDEDNCPFEFPNSLESDLSTVSLSCCAPDTDEDAEDAALPP